MSKSVDAHAPSPVADPEAGGSGSDGRAGDDHARDGAAGTESGHLNGVGPAAGAARGRGVSRGHHDQLAHAAAPGAFVAAHGGAPGFDPRRTLPLRIELRRQTRRRRTQVTMGLLVILPLILIAAFKLGSTGPNTTGQVTLLDLATLGAPNFTLFTLFAATGFLFVVVVAMFAGDTVASEASWASLRYLLIAPVGRSRLLRQKLIVTLGLSMVSLVLMPAAALLSGWAAFGWSSVRSPTGTTLTAGETLPRLAIIVAYIAISLLVVAALGSYAGVRTDAPLGAVGGTVLIVIVSNILDSVTALGGLRDVLPTHYSYSWLDALAPTVDWSGMLRGTLSSVAYSTVLFALTWRHFLRKDIVS
jgi:ABC-2 type transport system permease protein